jgi:glycerol-3-phosphate dehydrogenase
MNGSLVSIIMKNTYDVIVIGGGVTGTAICRELSRYRLRLALLEKEAELAFGVSKSNSGIVHPGTQNPPNSLKGRLCVEGNRLIRSLSQELGVHFVETGELIVVFSPEEMPALMKLKAEAEQLRVPRLRIVDSPWLRKNEPNLSPRAFAALYAGTAGIISPYRLTYDLSENAAKNGTEIHTNCRVTNIQVRSDRIFDVLTTSGTFQTRFLVNAAGLFADEISAMAGVSDFTIQPLKGEEYLLDKKREHIVNHILFPLPTPVSKGVLVIKTSDGNPMIGPTAGAVKDKNDLETSSEGLARVLESVQKMVPSIREQDIIAYFAGLRPSAGRDFIIRHEGKVPGFVNAAGIQSPGLTASPAIALMVKGLLLKNGLELKKKTNFHKKRKATIHLFATPFSRARNIIKKKPSFGDIVCRCEMVSAGEIREAVKRGARTLDGIKFRTRAQSGRCHGGFCTTRVVKILMEELKLPVTKITKRGPGSEIIIDERK